MELSSDVSRGVTIHGRFRNRSGSAWAIPVFSEPAIGWDPMKVPLVSSPEAACLQIVLFVLPTSVTKVPGFSAGLISL